MDLSLTTLLLGIAIFCARIVDVSLGTLRVINVVQGRMVISFFLGFVEVLIWVTIFSTVMYKVKDSPILAVFYSLGFATGSILGIKLEQKIGLGHSVVRFFTNTLHQDITDTIKREGYAVTQFVGEGMHGPVIELYCVCRRRDQEKIIHIAQNIVPDIFYTVEKISTASKMYPGTSRFYGLKSLVKR